MSTSQILDKSLQQATNEELIELINELFPITNQDFLSQIQKEFEQRNIHYKLLINFKNEFTISQRIRLIDNNIFELKIPKPPMVGPYFKKVKKLSHYLKSSPYLDNKKLVTFDYILDQFYLTTDDVQVIEEKEIQTLDNQHVFIAFRNLSQLFPNATILNQINHLETLVIIDKGGFYRGIKKVNIITNGKIVDVLSI